MPAGSRQKLVLKAINTFFFVGLSPKMPGTVGSLAALPLAWVLNSWFSLNAVVAVIFLLFLLGTYTSHIQVTGEGTDDPGEIVIDEVVGVLIATVALPLDPQIYLLAFAAFRVLDILKPPPIGYVDRTVKGGLGVMLDDVMAGLFAHVVILALMAFGVVAQS